MCSTSPFSAAVGALTLALDAILGVLNILRKMNTIRELEEKKT